MEDLSDATLSIGSGKAENLNFVCRYLLSAGRYVGDNFGDFANNAIWVHESDVDSVMQLEASAVSIAIVKMLLSAGLQNITICNKQGAATIQT